MLNPYGLSAPNFQSHSANNQSHQSSHDNKKTKVNLGEYEKYRSQLIEVTKLLSDDSNNPADAASSNMFLTDNLVRHHLNKVGCNSPDDVTTRFISAAVFTVLESTLDQLHPEEDKPAALTMQGLQLATPILRDSLVKK